MRMKHFISFETTFSSLPEIKCVSNKIKWRGGQKTRIFILIVLITVSIYHENQFSYLSDFYSMVVKCVHFTSHTKYVKTR